MGEIVNLRRARKQRARDHESAQAAEARARHGRSKPERANDARDAARLRAGVDGALLASVDQPVDEVELVHHRRGQDEGV